MPVLGSQMQGLPSLMSHFEFGLSIEPDLCVQRRVRRVRGPFPAHGLVGGQIIAKVTLGWC
jgi:hypothetical protein